MASEQRVQESEKVAPPYPFNHSLLFVYKKLSVCQYLKKSLKLFIPEMRIISHFYSSIEHVHINMYNCSTQIQILKLK